MNIFHCHIMICSCSWFFFFNFFIKAVMVLEPEWCNGLHTCQECKRFRVQLPVQVKIFLLKYYRHVLKIYIHYYCFRIYFLKKKNYWNHCQLPVNKKSIISGSWTWLCGLVLKTLAHKLIVKIFPFFKLSLTFQRKIYSPLPAKCVSVSKLNALKRNIFLYSRIHFSLVLLH